MKRCYEPGDKRFGRYLRIQRITLLDPGTILNLVGQIEDAILSLKTMPYCWASAGIKALLNTKKELGSI